MSRGNSKIRLQSRLTCPHCWHQFPPENLLWISEHPDLLGDPRLGRHSPQRFLPTRFNVKGDALDSKGFGCNEVACPNCHLRVSRALLELAPLFLSILGTPACGKSYFLASMVWKLRQTLPKYFGLAFGDADPSSNRILQEYEEQQFLNPEIDKLVAIRKTELQGELYDTVLFGDQPVSYPRPFLFGIRPLADHPNYSASRQISHALCLYDNAGEHFLPGSDTTASPVTRHLALSRVLLYLFDPTQDPRFRAACQGKTSDPQMRDRARTLRQETVLLEAADRIRRHAGLSQNAKHGRPLVVVVTKYDAWSSLFEDDSVLPNPWGRLSGTQINALNTAEVERVSQRVRALLWKLTPELVSAAEGFAQEVIYIPVSAVGRGPEVDPATGMLGVRPRDISPVWVEVPLLYSLCRWMNGIIPRHKPTGPLKVVAADDGDLRETGS